jgi:hypothetical protein
MSLLAILPSVPLLGPCVDAVTCIFHIRPHRSNSDHRIGGIVTNADGNDPVRELRSQTTIPVKKIAAEQVASSALAEGGDGWVRVSCVFDCGARTYCR